MQLITIDQAAEQLAVSRRTVMRLLDDGSLTKYKIGRCVRLSAEDVNTYITAAETPVERYLPEPRQRERFRYVPGMKLV